MLVKVSSRNVPDNLELFVGRGVIPRQSVHDGEKIIDGGVVVGTEPAGLADTIGGVFGLFSDGGGVKAFGFGGEDDFVAYGRGYEFTEDGVDGLMVGDFFERLGEKRMTFLSIDVVVHILTRTFGILILFVIFVTFVIRHGRKTKDIKDKEEEKGKEEEKDEKKKKEKNRILLVFRFRFRFIDAHSRTKRPILF